MTTILLLVASVIFGALLHRIMVHEYYTWKEKRFKAQKLGSLAYVGVCAECNAVIEGSSVYAYDRYGAAVLEFCEDCGHMFGLDTVRDPDEDPSDHWGNDSTEEWPGFYAAEAKNL